VKCDKDKNTECKSKEAIALLLDKIMVTMWYVDERVEFNDPSNLGGSPMKSIDVFHSQFQLNPDQYRDNNNFLVYN